MTTYEDRFNYLKLVGIVGEKTFGYDRYLNQSLYRSSEWSRIRNQVIARDYGFDLGVDGFLITGRIIIHHMNPITKHDIEIRSPFIYDPEFLISCSIDTHNAIHYGEKLQTCEQFIERSKNDTSPWLLRS